MDSAPSTMQSAKSKSLSQGERNVIFNHDHYAGDQSSASGDNAVNSLGEGKY